jgi:PIN domain nuclease of toxin-antitoxin system
MRVLLDTHVLVWFVVDSPQLNVGMKRLIEDENNEKLLSIASVWEMAIKQNTGKLTFGLPFKEFIEQQLNINSITILNINLNHIDVISTLPQHHRDPFDRLIIAQAIIEKIPIISADAAFDAYTIERLW